MTIVKSKLIEGGSATESILNGALHLLDTARGVLVPISVLENMTLKDFVDEVSRSKENLAEKESNADLNETIDKNNKIVESTFPANPIENNVIKDSIKKNDSDSMDSNIELHDKINLNEKADNFPFKENQTIITTEPVGPVLIQKVNEAEFPPKKFPPVETNVEKEIYDDIKSIDTKNVDLNKNIEMNEKEEINLEEEPANLTTESIVGPNMEEINKLRAVIADAANKLAKLQDQLDELNQILQYSLNSGKEFIEPSGMQMQ